MKKIFFLILLFSSMIAHAQKDTTQILLKALPDSTGFGTPDGKLVSKQIGTSGGAIISNDGRVELIFPAGALTANISISIQPITNKLNGSGKAYQMEPSGTQFKKPVKIIFTYTDEEAETCPPDLKSFALQDHKGKWSRFEYEEWDSTAKKLSGYIHHFSALVTDQNDVLLVPEYQFVGVGAYSIIFIHHRNIIDTGEFRGVNEFAEFASNRSGIFVNGIFGGNQLVGTMLRGGTLTGYSPISEGYTAPNILPKKNPVEIKLAFKYYSMKKKKIVWGTSKCMVTVYDMYKISVIYKMKEDDVELNDSANFIATIFPDKVELSDIKNYPPSAKIGDPPQCEAKIIIDGSCVGIVNIASDDIYNYKVSKDSPPEIFWKVRSKQILVYKFQYVCKQMTTPVTDTVLDSYPHEINFTANGQKQTINYDLQWFKIIVTPVREE